MQRSRSLPLIGILIMVHCHQPYIQQATTGSDPQKSLGPSTSLDVSQSRGCFRRIVKSIAGIQCLVLLWTQPLHRYTLKMAAGLALIGKKQIIDNICACEGFQGSRTGRLSQVQRSGKQQRNDHLLSTT